MRTAIVVVMAVVLIAALSGCVTLPRFTRAAARSASVPVMDATSVRIIAEAGSLEIAGLKGLTEVTASGTAWAMNNNDLEKVQFVTRTSETEIVIEARTPVGDSRFDVTVEVPDTLRVEIDDGSGDIVVRSVASVRLSDGSGDINVENVSGDVVVEDDGSGDIAMQYVGAGVEVTSDGTGHIDVKHVGASVVVGSDGSGNITVSDIKGDFRVRQDGSGDITATDIRGDFVVESDGSGSIRQSGIGGKVSIPYD